MIFIIALLARLAPGPRTIDDAYITYRYARNILAGNGFVYNPGERILGTTTPLYTILLVSLGSLSGGVDAPFPLIALIINAIADAATCTLIYAMGIRLGYHLSGMGAALIWAITPFSVTFAIGGLETSLFVFLLAAAAYSHQRNYHHQAALYSGLAYLARPDALILIAPLAIDRAYTLIKARLSTRTTIAQATAEILVFCLPTVPWTVFAAWYFGSPLPHSIAAKSLAYRLPSTAALVRLIQHYATPFLEQLTFGSGWIAVGLPLFLFLSLVGMSQVIKVNRRAWIYLIYPWTYFAVFALANPLIFRWYLTPPLLPYIFSILAGAEQLLTQAMTRIKLANRQARLVGQALPLILVLFMPIGSTGRGWTLHPDHGPDRPAPQMAWIQLELLYREAAQSLEPIIRTDTSPHLLAAGDVGVLGYFSTVPILDTVGLNSPQSIAYYPLDPVYYTINYAIPPRLILDMKPDLLVILEVYGREGLLQEAWFWRQYTLKEKIPTDIYGSDGMLIFTHN